MSSACFFARKRRKLICCVHGDDFATAGAQKEFDRLRKQLEERYELKGVHEWAQRPRMPKRAQCSAGVVQCLVTGVTREADPRQVRETGG